MGGGRPGRPPPPTRTGETGGGNGERKEPHARRPGTEGRDTQQETTEARRARRARRHKPNIRTTLLSPNKSPGLPRRRSMRAGAKFLGSPTQPNSALWRGCEVPRQRAAGSRAANTPLSPTQLGAVEGLRSAPTARRRGSVCLSRTASTPLSPTQLGAVEGLRSAPTARRRGSVRGGEGVQGERGQGLSPCPARLFFCHFVKKSD